MTPMRKTALALCLATLLAGCTQEDWDYFWAEEGDWSGMSDIEPLYRPSLNARQCGAIGGTYGAQGCWKM